MIPRPTPTLTATHLVIGLGGSWRDRHLGDASSLHLRDLDADAVHAHARSDDRDLAQFVHDEAADRVVGAVLGQVDVRAARELVGAQRAGNEESPVGARADADASLIVLVGDLTDDLFDDIFEGHDAGDAAVLVNDDGHLQALVAQLDHEGADRHGLGDRGRVGHEGRGDDGDLGATIGGYSDRAAQ